MHPLIEAYQETNQFGASQGYILEVIRPGHIRYHMAANERHLALPTVVHGGAIAALMDAALSVAGLSHTAPDDKLVGTVEFKINYLAPALKGDELVAEGIVIKAGLRLLTVEAEIRAANRDVLLAKGIGTLNAYPSEKSGL